MLLNTAINPIWLFTELTGGTPSLSLTYKVLSTTEPSYLYNLISVQPHHSNCSSDVVTLARPFSSSYLKVNNRSFRHASPCLWNQLPKEADSRDRVMHGQLDLGRSSWPACWSWRLITLIWSHTCQFIISFITTVIIHYSSLPLHAQNSSFPQIISIVLLPFHPPDWLHGLQ